MSANPYTRTMTLWIHDRDQTGSISDHEAVLNYELFPPGFAKPGDVAEVTLLPRPNAGGHVYESGSDSPAEMMERRSSYVGSTVGEEEPARYAKKLADDNGQFLFVIRELDESQRKSVNLQVNSASVALEPLLMMCCLDITGKRGCDHVRIPLSLDGESDYRKDLYTRWRTSEDLTVRSGGQAAV